MLSDIFITDSEIESESDDFDVFWHNEEESEKLRAMLQYRENIHREYETGRAVCQFIGGVLGSPQYISTLKEKEKRLREEELEQTWREEMQLLDTLYREFHRPSKIPRAS